MDDQQAAAGTSPQEIIAEQAQEIKRLRRQLAARRATVELRDALMLAASTGIIASPVAHNELLQMIIETAARLTQAEVAFLFMIDRNTNELVMEVGYGQDVQGVQKLRVPLGRGITGMVALTGEPVGVADTSGDARLASDAAQALGFIPRAIICIPLFYEHRIVGVLELMDKNGQNLFAQTDMDILTLFANQAAVAIEQSRTHRNMTAIVGEVITSLGGLPERRKQKLQQAASAFAATVEDDVDYQEALELAELVREIAWYGDAEFKTCKTLLQGFADYLQTRRTLAGMGAARGGRDR